MTTSATEGDEGLDFERQCPFPAVILYDDEVSAYDVAEPYLVCRLVDVRSGQRGRFARSELIDSNGNCWQVNGARVLHGVGPFWGWNLLLSRTVRVRPHVIAGPSPAGIIRLRHEVLRLLSGRASFTVTLRSFCTMIERAEVRKLIPQIQTAGSAAQLVSILLSAEFPERQEIMNEDSMAERGASPLNSGPTMPLGNSGVREGPPSVS